MSGEACPQVAPGNSTCSLEGDQRQPPSWNSSDADACPSMPSILRSFFHFANDELQDECTILSFRPVPADLSLDFAAGVLAPPPGGTLLDLAMVASLATAKRCPVFVGACISDTAEVQQAGTILSQLSDFLDRIIVFVVLLQPNGLEAGPVHVFEELLTHQKHLFQMGAHEVIIGPSMSPGCLKSSIAIMHRSRLHAEQQAELILDREQVCPSTERLIECKEHQQYLLWEAVPRLLKNKMPGFPELDRQILEYGDFVGIRNVRQYKVRLKYRCKTGRVYLADALLQNDSNLQDGSPQVKEVPAVMKVVHKADIQSPYEVEAIHREITFLRSLRHPNIAKSIDVLHASRKFYIIMEYAGGRNLEGYCAAQPDSRLHEGVAMNAFKQIANALGYMHTHELAHRNLSLHHVAVKLREEAEIHCTLVDFRDAVLAKGETLCKMVCGDLPFIAPEVASASSGQPYVPCFADSWSLGVLLLEMAGGLESLCRSAYSDKETDKWECVQAIVAFFNTPECHATALGKIGGVRSPQILQYLEMLLVLTPRRRKFVPDLAQALDQTIQQ